MTGAAERVLPLVADAVFLVLLAGREIAAEEEAPATPEAQAQPAIESEELFRRIFGEQPSGGAQRVVSPFMVDGEIGGQVMVVLPSAGAPLRIQAAPLLAKLRKLLTPAIHGRLTSMVDPEGNLSLDALNTAGLAARFDEKKLELHVETPAELRRTIVTSFRGGRAPPGLENALAPSAFSTYLNLRVGEDYILPHGQESAGRQPVNMTLEGAVNLKSWVLEGSAGYAERADNPWNRGDVRLIVDDPPKMLRFSAGDLSVPTQGYLRGAKMAGFMVARNFSLQPYRVTEPIGQYGFFLKSPSTVEVWINGGLVQTIELPAGPHDVRDLPLSVGFNEVRLRIIDAVGHEETLTFDAFSESELLASGLHQFAYSIGFPTTSDVAMRAYDLSRPAFSVFHRLGVLDTLTLGAYLEGSPDQQLGGIEGLWTNLLGLWGLEAALSDVADIPKNYAARLRYRNQNTGTSGNRQRTFGANIAVVGAQFGARGEGDAVANPYWLDLSASYGQRLFWKVNGALNGSYRFSQTAAADSYTASLAIGSPIWNGLQANLQLSLRGTSVGKQTQTAFLSLFWAIPKTQQHLSASHDTSTETSRVGWAYLSPHRVDGLNASAAVERTPQESGVNGSLDYAGYRSKTIYLLDATVPGAQFSDTALKGGLRFGTAVVLAGGRFALSSPVSDSFAIVVPNKQLKQLDGQTIRINPSGDDDDAHVDWLGPGVLPSLYSYHLSTLRVEAPDLPFGYELGQTKYDLLPTYKSGFLIRIGTEASVFLRGVLLEADGTPVVLQAGTIISRDDPKWEPVTMFTNRKGKFAVEGMKPGRYELNLFRYGEAVIHIEIPEGKVGIYDVGSLKLAAPGRGPSDAKTIAPELETMVVEPPEEVEAMCSWEEVGR